MAPSSGHLLVPKAWRVVKFAFEKASNLLQTKAQPAARTLASELQPVYLKNTTRHAIPRVAALRQGQSRWLSRLANNLTIRGIASSAKSATSYNRAAFPKSRIGAAVNSLTQRAPFASTLRPNLTGGTLCRTGGGYGLGSGRVGGARYFSHAPAAPAQVVNNVSAAVRAFWISGQKAQFDGLNPRSGEKRYRAVSSLQDDAGRKVRNISAPGSLIDFQVSPTITAFGPLSNIPGSTKKSNSLNSDGIIDLLSIDFARALKDLAVIMNDLKRLSTLGDLPLSMQDQSTLRVRFPGCDARTVERLCDELGVQRGVIRQDENFDAYTGTEMALLFPFAPSRAPSDFTQSPERHRRREKVDWQNMLSPDIATSPGYSRHSDTGLDYEDIGAEEHNPWLSSPSGYSSLHASDVDDDGAAYFEQPSRQVPKSEYEGLEGIYKFLEECDRAKR